MAPLHSYKNAFPSLPIGAGRDVSYRISWQYSINPTCTPGFCKQDDIIPREETVRVMKQDLRVS
jgi:hypothetical protein